MNDSVVLTISLPKSFSYFIKTFAILTLNNENYTFIQNMYLYLFHTIMVRIIKLYYK